MTIIQELEAMRMRMIQEINTEFDVLIDRLSREVPASNVAATPRDYEIAYPLVAGSGLFKGKKPIAVIIDNERFGVSTWKQLASTLLNQCMKTPVYATALRALAGKVNGQKRTILSQLPTGMRSPLKLETGLYFETHYDTETLLNILLTRILFPIGYDCKNVMVVIRNM